jgi:hypothetical protein
MIKKQITVNCSCNTESLRVEYDEDNQLFDLSIWNHQFTAPMSFRQRLRFCWQTLKGRPYSDQIILDKESVNELVNFFLDHKN